MQSPQITQISKSHHRYYNKFLKNKKVPPWV
jgi:hypothetical protein